MVKRKIQYRKYTRICIPVQSVVDLHLIVKPIFTYFSFGLDIFSIW